jgi:Ca2+/Na+ antiporter
VAGDDKTRTAIFLGLTRLTEDEQRRRRRIGRVVVYADAAVLLVGVVAFHRHFWVAMGSWWVVNIALVTWWLILLRGAHKQKHTAMASAGEHSRRRPLTVPLVVAGLGCILGGVSALVLAHNTSHARVPLGVVVLVLGVAFVAAGVILMVRGRRGDQTSP